MVGERIAEVRKNQRMSQRAMAVVFKISQGSYQKYESGDSLLNSEKLDILCREFKININWLLTGDGSMFYDEEDKNNLSTNKHYRVPVLGVVAEAGTGILNEYEMIAETTEIGLEFKSYWGKDLCVLRIVGDSMLPTIDNNGWVLVLRTSTIEKHEGIYIFLHNNILRCKRIQVDFEGAIRVISDNKLYDMEVYNTDTLYDSVSVIGEVVGILKKT